MAEKSESECKYSYSLRARVREFGIPPIHDGLVLGRNAPIGCVAMRRALDLLAPNHFEHIEVEDDTVSDILIRQVLLRRIPKERLIAFVVQQIKPLMSAKEVLHLDLEAEVYVEKVER